MFDLKKLDYLDLTVENTTKDPTACITISTASGGVVHLPKSLVTSAKVPFDQYVDIFNTAKIGKPNNKDSDPYHPEKVFDFLISIAPHRVDVVHRYDLPRNFAQQRGHALRALYFAVSFSGARLQFMSGIDALYLLHNFMVYFFRIFSLRERNEILADATLFEKMITNCALLFKDGNVSFFYF